VGKVKQMSAYDEKAALFAGSTDRLQRGIGIGMYAFGAPHTHGSHRMPRKVALIKDAEGRVAIRTTLIDMGQGLQTTFKKIALPRLEYYAKNHQLNWPNNLSLRMQNSR